MSVLSYKLYGHTVW